uniref:SYO1-like TPR repeats domain-containing protein n=1 Tax=Oncorhynchus tshawytscha TaxID=74940 RepID=A0A8C8F9C1_ONCTS
MGKSKTNKFRRPQFNAEGLSVTAVKEMEPDHGEVFDGVDSPTGELLEKLQSPSADVREFACASISRVVQQSQTIPGFLQRDAVRRLGPLMLDRSLAVRETATGALRNLSACGGHEVCDDMVKQDVMTPLTALLREVRPSLVNHSLTLMYLWVWPCCEKVVFSHFEQHVSCESSSQALSVFNKAGILDVILQCLERHTHNIKLALSAAHCLHTVTEDNAELLCSMNNAVLGTLESVLLSSQADMSHTLLRTLAAGSVWNLKSSLPTAHQAQTLTALMATLSQCLELDAGTLIPQLRQVEVARSATASEAGNMEDHQATKIDKDFSDLLPRGKEELREATALLTAQQTSLEIIVNMCCSDDPSDDEWEEASSSDESEMCPDGLSEGNTSLLSPLCLSAEVHAALINHNIPEKVLKKTQFPSSEAMDVCRHNPTWKILIKKMHRVQYRALTCLHNMLSTMDAESLGGAAALQAVAQHLSTLVFSPPALSQHVSWMTHCLCLCLCVCCQCMTPQQMMSLSEAATCCDVVSVRVNALAILGITGSTLAKENGTAETLQMIGNALLQVATKDANLVVCGEALDALFDVFADGDEAERAAENINLLSALKALQPVFKAKIRKEGKGKYSPEQLCVLDNVKVNLRRFIGYLETVVKK